MQISDDSLWLSRSAVSRLLGLSPIQFDGRIRRDLSSAAVRGKQNRQLFDAAECVAIHVRQIREECEDAGEGDSKWLEEQRRLRCLQIELQLEEQRQAAAVRRCELIPLDDIAAGIDVYGEMFQRLARDMRQRFGQEAERMCIEVSESAHRALVQRLKVDGDRVVRGTDAAGDDAATDPVDA